MRAIKCDRCGEFETVTDDPRIPKNGEVSFMHFNDNTKSWDAHDLCKSCLTQLDIWWKDKDINVTDQTVLLHKFYKDVTDEMKEEVEEKAKTDEIDKIKIEDLDLSVRCINILLRMGYITLGDLRGHLTLSLLRKCRNCGHVAEYLIVNKLREYGIEIPEGEEPKPIDLLPFKRTEEN